MIILFEYINMNKVYSLVIIFISFFIICKCFKLIENHENYKISGGPIPSNCNKIFGHETT